MLDKSKLNFIIDALMFLCMMAIIGLGFLMKFILIPGKERFAKYGRNVELLLLGMDRHEWGTIHLTLGFVLLGLLALHVILHWNVIIVLFSKLVDTKIERRIIAAVFLFASLFFLIVPLAVKPEIEELRRGEGHHEHGPLAGLEAGKAGCGGCPELMMQENVHAADDPMKVRGFMTLAEVSRQYNVPTHCLKTHLGIPESVSDEQKLGQLRRTYEFSMSDVEKVIAQYHGEGR